MTCTTPPRSAFFENNCNYPFFKAIYNIPVFASKNWHFWGHKGPFSDLFFRNPKKAERDGVAQVMSYPYAKNGISKVIIGFKKLRECHVVFLTFWVLR